GNPGRIDRTGDGNARSLGRCDRLSAARLFREPAPPCACRAGFDYPHQRHHTLGRTPQLIPFLLALLLFLALHSVPALPAIRQRLVGAMGRRGYLIAYSLASL